MSKRMLIDAAHADEIRIAVVDDERILEYDVQSAEKEQIRGNIYVGEVSRVEPSLQAAFITYGGNRNGFLAFSEIHPSCFNLPEEEKIQVLNELIGAAEEQARADEAEDEQPQRQQAAPQEDASREAQPQRHPQGRSRWAAPQPDYPVDDLLDRPAPAAAAAPSAEAPDAPTTPAAEPRRERRPQRQAQPQARKVEEAPVAPAAPEKKLRVPVQETGLEKVEVVADLAPEAPVELPKKPTRQKPVEAKTSVAARSDIQETELVVTKVPVDEDEPTPPAPKTRKTKALAFDNPTLTENLPEAGDNAGNTEGEPTPAAETGEAREGAGPRHGRRFDRNRGRDRDRGGRGRDRDRNRDRGGNRDERRFKAPVHRRFEIANVLKEGQKILVQISKEERGNKGAALTTYISLPGRYTVYMPNTPYAGGVSRKITDFEERKQLKRITNNLQVEKGAGIIVRTAGLGQPQEAIERDLTLLKSQWQKIQETYQNADEPTLAHEDGSLIVRALRDMVTDDIEEVIIEGDKAFRSAKEFISQVNPEFADKVKQHSGSTPIFTFFGVEDELIKLHRSRVNLPSGGYIIINPTEALVSIDVNSGSATQQKSIEDTALNTNLEAAEEIARQLRLRDLSGLIVIDFIDMEDNRHERKVEWALRQAVRFDRARTKVGNLSEFGLLEMSRQRMRPSLGESSFVVCPHCQGSGMVRSPASAALLILRRLEDPAIAGKADKIVVTTETAVAIYMLNYRRDLIQDIESKFKIRIVVKGDDHMVAPDHKLELVSIKSDGTQVTQVIDYKLHDDQESEGKANRRRRQGGKDKRNPQQAKDKAPAESAAPQEAGAEAAPVAAEAAAGEPREERGERGERFRDRGRGRDRHRNRGRDRDRHRDRPRGDHPRNEQNQNAAPGNQSGNERVIRDEDVVQPSPAEQEEQRKSVFQRWWNK